MRKESDEGIVGWGGIGLELLNWVGRLKRSPPPKAEVPFWIPSIKEQRHCVLLGTVERVMTQSLRVESPYSGGWHMAKVPPFVPAPFVYSRLSVPGDDLTRQGYLT